jgi:amino acid adenylation domain-containing protein
MRVMDAFPLSMLQGGMLYHSQHDAAMSTYQDIMSIEVSGPLDIAAFQETVDAAVRRHSALRTGFDLTSFSEPMQVIYEDVPATVRVVDIADLTAAEQQRHLDNWRDQELRTQIPWAAPPLARFYVHRLAVDRHRMGLCFQHAILDGWSLALLVTELMTSCGQRVTQRHSLPTPSPMTMRDYVALERLAIDDHETKEFWAGVLRERSFTALPRWPEITPGDQGNLRLPIAPDVSAALSRYTREEGLPLRSVLLAAHVAVLRFVSGDCDICTGLVTHGRPEAAGGGEVLGLFLNTVPFRMHVGDSSSWHRLIRRTFEAEAAMMKHRRYPLAQMHRDHLKAGESLFEVAFDFRNFHVYESLPSDGDLGVTGQDFFERNNFPLTVNANTTQAELTLKFNFDPRQFPAAQIDQLAGYYEAALASIARDPRARIELDTLLSPAARKTLVEDWNDTDAPIPSRTVDQLIRAQADRAPDAVAITYGNQVLRYSELMARADALQARLIEQGVQRGQLVGIFLHRSLDAVVAMLAVMGAGAAYLPMDPRYPAGWMRQIVDDSGVGLVLTCRSLADETTPLGSDVMYVDDTEAGPAIRAASVPHHHDDLAYVIYTSGSTGRPKGVMVRHGSVVNVLRSVADLTGASQHDVVLATTSLSFDIAALEIFMPLMIGARLVVADDLLLDPQGVVATLTTRPTLMQATPAGWRQILADDLALPADMKVLCGGEALPDDLARNLGSRFSQVWNVYGPTETTIWSSADPISETDTPTLGRPLANTQLYVLDESALVPAATPGQLWIGGAGLARGYLGQPALTADRYRPDPYARQPGARMYSSGDVVRRLPDGRIEFLGRADHQVKLHGHRIELGEIETAILTHASVTETAVVLQDDGDGDRRLIAYVVLNPDVRPPSDPRGYLAAKLPRYMVPSVFLVLDVMPLTANGKLDRRLLPRAGRGRPVLARTPTPPRDDLERNIATVWADTLRFEAIGIYDDFFDLGGDSLLALRLLAKLRRELSAEVPAAVLFERGTVAAVAESIRSGSQARTGPAICLHPSGSAAPVFCVHPLGGHVFSYRDLAAHLGAAGHPFYAMQAPGLESGEPMDSIAGLAAHYLNAVRAVQPRGPYLLTGWCMGGVVAYEMACQLAAVGESTDLMAIISANANEPVPEAYARDEGKLLLNVVYGGRLELRPEDLAGLTSEERLNAVFTAAKGASDVRQDIMTREQLRRITRLYQVHAEASLSYEPGQLDSDVVLYRPSEGHEGAPPDLGWAKFVRGQLEIETINGTHYTLLGGPNGEVLAERILARIARTAGSPQHGGQS